MDDLRGWIAELQTDREPFVRANMQAMVKHEPTAGGARLDDRRLPPHAGAHRRARALPADGRERAAGIRRGSTSRPRCTSAPTPRCTGSSTATGWPSAIPGTELVVFEDSGHVPMWEEPDRFNETHRPVRAAAGVTGPPRSRAAALGEPLPRREDDRLLRGAGRFVSDVPCPGALHAAFVRSPYPHAVLHGPRGPRRGARRAGRGGGADRGRRRRARAAAREAAADRRRRWTSTSASRTWRGERVRFAGEPVAMVVATDAYAAADAAALIIARRRAAAGGDGRRGGGATARRCCSRRAAPTSRAR